MSKLDKKCNFAVKKTLPLAIMAICYGIPEFSLAQNGEVDALEEIYVTGFKGSLKSNLDAKRNSVGMVDTITAENIGEFPDNNLADAMGRVPGVAIVGRENGQGKNISVRGLSPTFTRTRLNGMEIGSLDFGSTDRAFDFNTFASELFSRIDVKKSTEAKLEEGSLGATVELYTARPLDYSDDSLVLSAKLGENSNADDMDTRFAALYSIQNDAHTLGAALSLAYSNFNIIAKSRQSGRWEANTGDGNNQWDNADSLPDEVNNAFHPRFPRYLSHAENEYDRLGLTGTVQWEPAETTSLTLDVLQTYYDRYQNAPALTPISLSRTNAGGRIQTTVNDYEVNTATNALVYADFSGVDLRSEGTEDDSESETTQTILTFEHEFTDSLRLHALAGTAASEYHTIFTQAIIEAFNQDFAYDYRNGPNPVFTYGFELADPSSWLVSEARYADNTSSQDFDSLQFDLSWDLNDTLTLHSGLSRKVFEFSILHQGLNRNFHTPANQGVLDPGLAAACPDVSQEDLVVGNDMGSVNTDLYGQSWFLPDWQAFGAQIGHPSVTGNWNTDTCYPLDPGSSGRRNVKETSDGLYVQLDFETDIANMAFEGNAGVRTVTTEVESTGDIATAPTTVVREYDDNLPSLNVGLWLTEDVIARLSWAEVMARPSLGDLSPGGSVDSFNRRYTAGNPGLDPFRAKATDLALEWYFSDEGLLSLAYFKKDIESFPATIPTSVPWTALGLPNSLLQSPATPDDIFEYISKQNGDGGDLDGFELQYQTPFTVGPNWVQDFGVKFAYTSISSKVNNGNQDDPIIGRLTGQADEAYNLTLWYDNESFEGRVSYFYTGDSAYNAISRLNISSGPRAGIQHGEDINDETAYVDAKFSYHFNDALTLSLELLNLTDEPTYYLMGSNGYRLEDSGNFTGKTYWLSVQYSFL